MRRVILVALSAALLACGGNGAPTAPSVPNVLGTYGGASAWNWSFLWGYVFGLPNWSSASCPGSISITNQSDSNFSGSFVIEVGGDCIAGFSGTVSGTISADRDVNFDAAVPGRGHLIEFLLHNCVYASGDTQLKGWLSADGLRLQASANATGDPQDCSLRFSGTR